MVLTEYEILKCNLHAKNIKDKMNELSKEGWKLVCSSVAQDGPFLIFSKNVEPVDLNRAQAIIDRVNHGKEIRNPITQ